MSWFGWLTKSKLEVTMLDEVTLGLEIVGVVIFFLVLGLAIESIQKK